jgi:hypothetical protein
MYPIFFDFDKKTGKYLFTEVSVEYRMTLSLMLQLKKYLRQHVSPKELQPIWNWYSSLNPDDLKDVSLSIKHEKALQ